MKKSFLFCALLLFIGCESDSIFPRNASIEYATENRLANRSAKIDYAEALEIVQQGIAMLESASVTRSETGRSIDPEKVEYRIVPATRSGDNPDTLMYVFNFADSAGFALIAADRRADRLLAVVENGCYTPGEPTGNPGFDWYMKCTDEYLNTLSMTGGGEDKELASEYIYKLEYEDDIEDAGPLVTVKWNQYYPYNLYCSTNSKGEANVAGCVAIAIAQIVSYHAFPQSIRLTYANADTPTLNLNWPIINKHIKTYECNIDCTEHAAIGYLCRQIGELVHMQYGSYNDGGSTATNKYVPNCFTSLGYTTGSIQTYDYAEVRNSLNQNQPLYVSGQTNNSNTGHAWVIDGYKTITRTTKVWKSLPPSDRWILDEESLSVQKYIHCNWGWGGTQNGWYNETPYLINDYNKSTMKILSGIEPK